MSAADAGPRARPVRGTEGGGATAPGPIRAVIADDEPSAREVIRGFVQRDPRLEIVGEATHGDEAVQRVRELGPDLLFLDVQMPDRDGFGVLEALGDDVPRGVVFVTAHDEYALRAFEVHALDYLLKPFGHARFREAVERALRRLAGEVALDMRRTLETLIEGQRDRWGDAGTLVEGTAEREAKAGGVGPVSPARIGVRRGTRTILVNIADIEWIEAADDFCRLHVGPESHLVASRMHELESRLPSDVFFRIHRSAIVNLARIAELRREPDGGGLAVLEAGVRLRVARSRWEDLERALGL